MFTFRRYPMSSFGTWKNNDKNTNWECFWLAFPFYSYVASPSKLFLTSTKSYFALTWKGSASRRHLLNFVSTSRIYWYASIQPPILSFTSWEEKNSEELGVKLICVERQTIQGIGMWSNPCWIWIFWLFANSHKNWTQVM